MEKNQNDPDYQYNTGGSSIITAIIALFIVSLVVSSCSVVEGIFKAGMGFGIFAVLAVFVVIVFFVSRFRKK